MTLEILVNGAPRPAAEDASLASFLRDHDLEPRLVVVERNGEIVPRERFGGTRLEDGDRLEIVHFVGGG